MTYLQLVPILFGHAARSCAADDGRAERPNRDRMASFWPIYGYRAERSDLELSAAALECARRSG